MRKRANVPAAEAGIAVAAGLAGWIHGWEPYTFMVPKVRQRGYIPFFVAERKKSEAALIQVLRKAFVQCVSTRKMEKLVKSLGIENLSRSQLREMTKD